MTRHVDHEDQQHDNQVAVERRDGGNMSEIIAIDTGEPPASAAPTKTRAITNCMALVAAEQMAVAKLHTASMPANKWMRDFTRSISRPNGMPKAA